MMVSAMFYFTAIKNGRLTDKNISQYFHNAVTKRKQIGSHTECRRKLNREMSGPNN